MTRRPWAALEPARYRSDAETAARLVLQGLAADPIAGRERLPDRSDVDAGTRCAAWHDWRRQRVGSDTNYGPTPWNEIKSF